MTTELPTHSGRSNPRTATLRKTIQDEAYKHGLRLDKEARETIVEFVVQTGGDETLVYTLLDSFEAGGTARVTNEQVNSVLLEIKGRNQSANPIQVISAFEVPKLRYDALRKGFFPVDNPSTLHGDVQDKLQLYLSRFLLLQQRLQRHRNFCKPALQALNPDGGQYLELTELKALLSVTGETRYIMGVITQLEDGRYFLEDLSASMPLDLSSANTGEGFFIENTVVLVEGQLQASGVFKADALGFVPLEPASASRIAAKEQDFFGGEELTGAGALEALQAEAAQELDRLVMLSDVWLDRPEIMAVLRTIFSGFEQVEQVPPLFVLMGNFHSQPCSGPAVDYTALRANFQALGSLMAQFPRLMAESRFVFVPGPGDVSPAAVLPQPPLPSFLTSALADALPAGSSCDFASNPCRLRYFTQQIVLFRQDLLARMRRLCLIPPAGTESSPNTMFRHLALTLLQQSHLCPLPLERQPVFWQHDHALHLYPVPDVLVVADRSPAAEVPLCDTQDCVCFNPGSLADATFAAYAPSSRAVEMCEVPPDGTL